ncbi:DUF302 domain-containing protein [Fictibacillus aquaticus]|uniref:DUF302 domain-containing protein n=1 Tax=Fictibacillus aquaticus TaxID=2021314 RepID=A0A235F6K0_9BACL|nr:DUF302 domain-containing protein [Fictibacillus aquaticus]OYD56910.1 hypothetical protein CGZ90_15270 [Fictibacillus aquaticus]
MFHYTVETSMGIEEAAKQLEETLKAEKFGVLWQFNVKDKLQEKGLDFDQEYLILEVCNPHEAKEVLSINKMIGYFLPCKIVLYTDSGKTKIGMPKPTEFVKLIDDANLEAKAKDIEDRLIACLDKSVQ